MHYGAGAAGYSTRDRAALALIFGMHILGLVAWMQQRPARLPDAPHVVTFWLRPSAPPPRPITPAVAAPPTPVYPSLHKLPPPPDAFGSAAAPAPRPAASASPAEPTKPTEPAKSSEPAEPAAPTAIAAPAATGLEAARPPTSVRDAIREQQQAEGGFGLNLSKRQAGRIDRELRHGKSGVPDEPDTPMGRFRRGLEAAHIDRSKSVHFDTYTSPDGTIIYRTRIGSGSICRRGGNISPLGMSRMKMAGEAADNIPCPNGVEWKKE